jgi:hypothetical protein
MKLGGRELRVDGVGFVVLRRWALHHSAPDAAAAQQRFEVSLQLFAIARGGKYAGDPDLLAAARFGDAESPACKRRLGNGGEQDDQRETHFETPGRGLNRRRFPAQAREWNKKRTFP